MDDPHVTVTVYTGTPRAGQAATRKEWPTREAAWAYAREMADRRLTCYVMTKAEHDARERNTFRDLP